MADLTIVITDAGRAEIINAENTGTAPVKIAEIGVSSERFTPTRSQSTLPSEIKRLDTIAGEAVAAHLIHVSVRDESPDVYTMYSFGLYTESGTLFAVYSQEAPILDKTAASILFLSADIAFDDINATSLTFGDTDFMNPPATETTKGVVELATNAEVQAGADTVRAVTPAGLASLTSTPTRRGLIELATDAEATAGTDTQRAINPKQLMANINAHANLKNNPHGVTKAQIGLSNVDNVSAASLRDRSTHTGTQPASTITGLGSLATKSSVNNSDWSGTDLAIANGGTGASTAADARTNLSVYSKAESDGKYAEKAQNLADLPNKSIARTNLELGSLATRNTINNDQWGGTDLSIANGGTGASTAAAARTNLGLGSLATKGSINNSDWSGTALAVANGGTGASSAADARTNLSVYSKAESDGKYAEKAQNLADLPNKATARTNLELGSLATRNTINNAQWSGTALAIGNGGTGASTAATARTNLGLGSLATKSSVNNSDWSGTDLAIANGGTGASTAADARTNLSVYSKSESDARYWTQSQADGRYLRQSNNLSDLSNKATAWNNLWEGRPSSVGFDSITVSGTVNRAGFDRLRFINTGGMMGIEIKDLCVTDNITTDQSKVPSNGAYIKGDLNCSRLITRTTSDRRLKTKVRRLPVDYDKLDRLYLVTGFYNALAGDLEGQKFIGSVAQDIREVFPHCVSSQPHETLGEYWAVDYPQLALAVALAELQRPLKYRVKRFFRQLRQVLRGEL